MSSDSNMGMQSLDSAGHVTVKLKPLKVDISNNFRDRSLMVFDSHSGEDSNGMAFLDSLFSSTNHKRYRYSFTEDNPPHSETIRLAISSCASMIVTLSDNLKVPHSAMWVGYEVGTAHDLKKNIIVFENYENDWVNLPVPYVDAYIQRPNRLNRFVEPFKTIAESAGMSYEINTNPKGSKYNDYVTCPNPTCKAHYYAVVYRVPFPCPVCRHTITDSNLNILKIQKRIENIDWDKLIKDFGSE